MSKEKDKIDKKEKISKDNKKKKNKSILIILIIIILIIISLTIMFFVKDENGVSYINKVKSYFIIQDNIQNKKDEAQEFNKYQLSDYCKIETKIGKDENFKYEYISFSDKLSSEIYQDFILRQNEFMQEQEEYYIKRELKTIAEVLKDILFIFSIETSYIEDMPVVDSFDSLYIDLETNKLLSNNDVIALFDYNLEGILNKVLDNMVQNTNADHYYLSDETTIFKKDEFEKNIPVYAQDLSREKIDLVSIYVKDGKLYVAYIESSLLSFLDLTYDKYKINETISSIELFILKDFQAELL